MHNILLNCLKMPVDAKLQPLLKLQCIWNYIDTDGGRCFGPVGAFDCGIWWKISQTVTLTVIYVTFVKDIFPDCLDPHSGQWD